MGTLEWHSEQLFLPPMEYSRGRGGYGIVLSRGETKVKIFLRSIVITVAFAHSTTVHAGYYQCSGQVPFDANNPGTCSTIANSPVVDGDNPCPPKSSDGAESAKPGKCASGESDCEEGPKQIPVWECVGRRLGGGTYTCQYSGSTPVRVTRPANGC
jgi:hypothetical protein